MRYMAILRYQSLPLRTNKELSVLIIKHLALFLFKKVAPKMHRIPSLAPVPDLFQPGKYGHSR